MSHVQIHRHKPGKGERNQYTLAVVFWDHENSGAWRRSMAHKGIEEDELAYRKMTPRELEVHKKTTRLGWVCYDSWEPLIQDEWDETQDRTWCEELRQISRLQKSLDEILAVPVAPVKPHQSEMFNETNDPY